MISFYQRIMHHCKRNVLPEEKFAHPRLNLTLPVCNKEFSVNHHVNDSLVNRLPDFGILILIYAILLKMEFSPLDRSYISSSPHEALSSMRGGSLSTSTVRAWAGRPWGEDGRRYQHESSTVRIGRGRGRRRMQDKLLPFWMRSLCWNEDDIWIRHVLSN